MVTLELLEEENMEAVKSILQEEKIIEEKTILIAKKNPLESQILSKVINNMGYKIEIVEALHTLKSRIKNPKYDMLLIDKELKEFNNTLLEEQHSKMHVIMLTNSIDEDKHYNEKLVKEILSGVITRGKVEQLIQKYKG